LELNGSLRRALCVAPDAQLDHTSERGATGEPRAAAAACMQQHRVTKARNLPGVRRYRKIEDYIYESARAGCRSLSLLALALALAARGNVDPSLVVGLTAGGAAALALGRSLRLGRVECSREVGQARVLSSGRCHKESDG